MLIHFPSYQVNHFFSAESLKDHIWIFESFSLCF